MSHRTQVVLTDSQYTLLIEESHRTGASLGELVRRAVDQCYPVAHYRDQLTALQASYGSWVPRA